MSVHRYLLDTHTLLWYDTAPERLPPHVRKILRSRVTDICISSASLHELGHKHRLGRIPEAAALLDNAERLLKLYGFETLSINAGHALRAGTMDWEHQDPFDRVLAVQAMAEERILVTCDAVFTGMRGLKTLW